MAMKLFRASRAVQLIAGHEPRREGEYPVIYAARSSAECDRIAEEEYDCGTYTETWFMIYTSKGELVRKMNASAVAEVHYV